MKLTVNTASPEAIPSFTVILSLANSIPEPAESSSLIIPVPTASFMATKGLVVLFKVTV